MIDYNSNEFITAVGVESNAEITEYIKNTTNFSIAPPVSDHPEDVEFYEQFVTIHTDDIADSIKDLVPNINPQELWIPFIIEVFKNISLNHFPSAEIKVGFYTAGVWNDFEFIIRNGEVIKADINLG